MTGTEFENGVNNILDNTPDKGVNGSGGVTKAILKQIVAFFRDLLNDVNVAYEAGMNWRGAWSSTTAYAVRDVVTANGNTYRCKLAHTNQAVTNGTFWDLVAAAGNVQSNPTIDFMPKRNSLGNYVDSAISEISYTNGVRHRNTSQIRHFRNEMIWSGEITTSFTGKCVMYIDFGPNTLANTVTNIEVEMHSIWGNVQAQDCIVCEYNFSFVSGTFQSTNKIVRISSPIIRLNFSMGNLQVLNNRLVLPVFGNNFGQSFSFRIKATTINTSFTSVRDLLQGITLTPWATDASTFVQNIESIPREIAYHPNGSNVVFDLRRPYPFTWSVVNNDGVTINSQPSSTVAANTTALITLTGNSGKTLTISLIPNT